VITKNSFTGLIIYILKQRVQHPWYEIIHLPILGNLPIRGDFPVLETQTEIISNFTRKTFLSCRPNNTDNPTESQLRTSDDMLNALSIFYGRTGNWQYMP
jgi:hypothetical protein